MTLFSRFRSWLRATLHHSHTERDMDAELRFHLETYADDLICNGIPRNEAFRRARLEFGGLELTKEDCRDARRANVVESLLQDLRFGVRTLRKSPAFTAIAILTLAMGIGANTAIFSVVHAVLLKPLPFPDSDRLVQVWEKVSLPNYQNDQNSPSPGNFADWKTQSTAFEDISAYRNRSFNLTGSGEPLRVEGEQVSASLFSLLKVNATLGRIFSAKDDQPAGRHVVVIGNGLWKSRFASDATILGKSILLDGESYSVIGVMPQNFHFPDPDDQLWVPLALTPQDLANHGSHYLLVVGRSARPARRHHQRSHGTGLLVRPRSSRPSH